jgi:peptidoglycan/xylan/chitin deacetylase (PgdA/CDA1 family)
MMSQVVPILLYHTVDTAFGQRYRRWAVTPDTFSRHMDVVARTGSQPMTVTSFVEALERPESLPPRPVLITFDDGLRDFLTGALPILKGHGFPATLYVVSGCVGGTSTWLAPLGEDQRPMLSWPELHTVAAGDVEVGAHSHSHPQLDLLSPARARAEIFQSKSILEHELGRPVKSFAYPHGYSSRRIRRYIQEAGFTSACQVRHALSATTENRFTLSRIIMTSEVSDGEFENYLAGAGLPVSPPRRHLMIAGWRMVRQARRMAGLPS